MLVHTFVLLLLIGAGLRVLSRGLCKQIRSRVSNSNIFECGRTMMTGASAARKGENTKSTASAKER